MQCLLNVSPVEVADDVVLRARIVPRSFHRRETGEEEFIADKKTTIHQVTAVITSQCCFGVKTYGTINAIDIDAIVARRKGFGSRGARIIGARIGIASEVTAVFDDFVVSVVRYDAVSPSEFNHPNFIRSFVYHRVSDLHR